MVEQTPMIRQYLRIKSQYPDAILFFRLGDFYEMFFEDAEIASRELELTLTSRNKNAEEKVPLCGVPYHAASSYIARLVARGYKVAICDQVEDPRSARGIVKREVTRVVTPGVLLDTENLPGGLNNYLLALASPDVTGTDSYGLSFADISTGEFRCTECKEYALVREEILRVDPREIIVPDEGGELGRLEGLYKDRAAPLTNVRPPAQFDFAAACRLLEEHFGPERIQGLVAGGHRADLCAAGAVLGYLRNTQRQLPRNVHRIVPYEIQEYMILEESTLRNLEVVQSQMEGSKRHSLLGVLDSTMTSMGARRLRRWLQYPLLNIEAIEKRLDAVEELKEKEGGRAGVRTVLEAIQDLERLIGRICLNQGTARDLLGLKNSLAKIPELRERAKGFASQLLVELERALDPLDDVVSLIERSISEDAPAVVREGGIIRRGYHQELDELRSIATDAKRWIAALEATERTRTGIGSLKIRYNKVFGYSIEVTKPNLGLVPEEYQRKQTLAHAERFTTAALRELEDKILGAEERAVELEHALFQEVRAQVAEASSRIGKTADAVASIDALQALAEVASRNRYCRPELTRGKEIVIWEGRHPVVEAMDLEERFVPNDAVMDGEANRTVVLTGPNMAGKSTYMRQIALIVLMAQAGSFVPAEGARIGLVDRIFTRIGAMDNIVRGQSTFMVEMRETSGILGRATDRSLILLDEIGRGTSTFDGISIAWGVAEYIHTKIRCRTLFATHYHELADLAAHHPGIQNLNVAAKEWGDSIVFLRKVLQGSASHSYGIQVARLAGIPEEVIRRAKEILANLESGQRSDSAPCAVPSGSGEPKERPRPKQLPLFQERGREIIEEVLRLDVAQMRPVDALVMLQELKDRLLRAKESH